MKWRELIIFIEIIIRLKMKNHHHQVKNALGKDQGINKIGFELKFIV